MTTGKLFEQPRDVAVTSTTCAPKARGNSNLSKNRLPAFRRLRGAGEAVAAVNATEYPANGSFQLAHACDK